MPFLLFSCILWSNLPSNPPRKVAATWHLRGIYGGKRGDVFVCKWMENDQKTAHFEALLKLSRTRYLFYFFKTPLPSYPFQKHPGKVHSPGTFERYGLPSTLAMPSPNHSNCTPRHSNLIPSGIFSYLWGSVFCHCKSKGRSDIFWSQEERMHSILRKKRKISLRERERERERERIHTSLFLLSILSKVLNTKLWTWSLELMRSIPRSRRACMHAHF